MAVDLKQRADQQDGLLFRSLSLILMAMGPEDEDVQEEWFRPLIGANPEELAAALFPDEDET